MPMSVDSPILFQLPPSVNSVNTAFALFRGAKTQRGIRMAKKPKTCRIRIKPSTIGRCFTSTVLKMMAIKLTAITSSVPWYRSKT